MAEQASVTITITGDNEGLNKALQESGNDLKKFAGAVSAQGKSAGTNFSYALSGGAKQGLRSIITEFDNVSTAAQSGFSGLARSFFTLALNPITAGLATLGATIIAAFQFAKIGEENEKIAKNFKAFATEAGLDAENLKNRIAAVADGFVDLEDVLPRASEAVLNLGKNANRIPEILQLARNISIATGRDIEQVFSDLTKGIENQNEKLLKGNLIRIDTKKSIDDYAKANGTVAERLTDAAKQQAILNAVLEQGRQKFGETAQEATPIAGGIKKIQLAFDDVRDSLAALANSKFGEIFADGLGIAAQAIQSIVSGIDRISGKPLTLEQEYQKLNDQLTRYNELAMLNPNLADQYNKEIEAINLKKSAIEKELEMKKLISAEEERQAAFRSQLTEQDKIAQEMTAAQVKEKEAAIFATQEIQAQDYSIRQQMEADHQLAMAAIAADGNMNTEAVRQASLDAQIQRNMAEYDAEMAKAAKIKDLDQRVAAEKLAQSKMIAANQKAADAQAVNDARLTAESKMQIENNLFAAANTLVDRQSALGKALAVAEAIRNTYRGATLALATYPPPFGAAAAASTVALGLAQVAKITAANVGALVTQGQTGVDNQPFLLSKGEIVAPAKSFDEVIEGTARQRGFVKGDDNAETNALLRELIDTVGNRSGTLVTVNTDVIADDNGINKLVERIRDAIEFNSAPTLG